MSWAKFDLESDGRFLASARDLGTAPAKRIVSTLRQMSGYVSWAEMIRDCVLARVAKLL